MKITRQHLRQIIKEAVQQDSVDLANAALGFIQGWQGKGKDVHERAKRAHSTVQANKEFNKMRKSGTAVKDQYATVFLTKVTELKTKDKELFKHFKDIGVKITIKAY
jgi:hypothetical protein|tara:strand:- start:804 stop:1124 length:321 start_codon:yes stop_codon:yes gene_type:complete